MIYVYLLCIALLKYNNVLRIWRVYLGRQRGSNKQTESDRWIDIDKNKMCEREKQTAGIDDCNYQSIINGYRDLEFLLLVDGADCCIIVFEEKYPWILFYILFLLLR